MKRVAHGASGTRHGQDVFAVAFFYWATILLVRLAILAASDFGATPAITIHGVHVHHFVLGFGLLAVLFLRSPGTVGPVLAGIGLGLALDESLYWSVGRFEYWDPWNFIAEVSVGMVLAGVAVSLQRPANVCQERKAREFRRNPSNPFVTVVIPAYNEEQSLPSALESIIRQTYQNFELIVVDNESTDRTAAIAHSFGVRLLPEKRRGVARARQRGFAEARGQLIATTDADTVVPADWLSRIVAAFNADKRLVAVGGLYELSTGPLLARAIFPNLALPAWCLDKWLRGGWSLPGCNLAVSKKAFQESGGFNTALNIGEDTELSQRLRRLGLGKVKLHPTLLVRTSGRRYGRGFFRGLFTYRSALLPSALTRKKVSAGELVPVRAEPAHRSPLTSVLATVTLLLALFLLHNSAAAQGPQEKLRQHIRSAGQKLHSRLHFRHRI